MGGCCQYLVIKNALSHTTVAELNDTFDRQLRDEKPEGALSWYLNRERDHVQPDGTLSPRTLWHNDLILPGKVAPVLRELCSSFEWVCALTPLLSRSSPVSTRRASAVVHVTLLACTAPPVGSQGHLHPDCPQDKIGRFRLDHDNAHWIGPYDPDHTPDDAADFPEEEPKRADGSPYPGMATWSPVGIIQDGLHGGPPLYHISCMYELQPIGKGEGGFGCIVVSTHML
jgi:hypothetical protein